MYTNTNMTIYNKYTNITTKKTTYKKHLIDNVFWDDSLQIKINNGNDNNDKVQVFIPKNKNDMSKYIESINYNGEGWTIQNGDYIVKGNCNKSEIETISELSNYNVFKITNFDDKDYGSKNMHHFEIRGN